MNGEALSPMLRLRAEAARRRGCEVELLDAETGYLVEIRRGARRQVLLGGFSPLNPALAARLAEDKFHTALLLGRAGFQVPPAARCLKPGRFTDEDFSTHTGLTAARRLADEHAFPLVVKPNRGARGRDVLLAEDLPALEDAVRRIWENDYLALVQPRIDGVDVRLDFLDDTYLFGYLRRPLVLTGDGQRSLRKLFVDADPRFSGEDFERLLAEDPVWRRRRLAGDGDLTTGGGDLTAVLPPGEVLDLGSAILNLNRLCIADFLPEPPKAWLDAGRAAGRVLGLRHFGVDFKTSGLDADPKTATVLEVNASPSLVQMSRRGFYEETLQAEMRVVEAILGEGQEPPS